ncbi:hypothetical protein UT300007_27990 [Clostridium sp. CTA-7]
MDLYTELEIYRIAVLVGIYSKEDLIRHLDKLIEELDDIPYEIIEASLGKKIDNILMTIKELINKHNIRKNLVLGSLIKILKKRYSKKLINAFEGIYFLEQLRKHCDFSDYDREYITYLSDGYYLANESIYGEMNKIKTDFNSYLSDLIYRYIGDV